MSFSAVENTFYSAAFGGCLEKIVALESALNKGFYICIYKYIYFSFLSISF